MNLTLLAAILSSSLELRAQIVGGHVLQVLLVPHGAVPVVVTPHTVLGCYIEVNVLDETGVLVGRLGPRASCPTPSLSDFRALRTDDANSPFGGDVFGAEFDLVTPGRVRLGVDGELGGLQPGRSYRLVAIYHNDDESVLNAKDKASLRSRYGKFWSSTINLQSPPIPFRCPS